MRTGLFLLTGFLLLAAALILGRLFSANYPNASVAAVGVFAVVWFAIAAFNMWIGVAKAGYSVAEELPIFALIALLPVAIGVLLKWKIL